MTPDDFSRLFDTITASAFRFEGLPEYAVDEEDPDLRAWRSGLPQAERSVRTSPWLARIARQTVVDGVDWSRVRYVSTPLPWYLRWEIGGYIESQAAGERILLTADRSAWDGPDFWLFDAGTDHAHAVLMHYDDHGTTTGYEPVTDAAALARLRATATALRAAAVPLNWWLVEHADEVRRAGAA